MSDELTNRSISAKGEYRWPEWTRKVPMEHMLTIACDESGAEGENIMGSRDPVFVHGSTSIPLDEAEAVLLKFRATTKTQAPEIKSRTALRQSNRDALIALLQDVGERGNIYLLDKQFFMSAKLVNTLIAEPAAQLGLDMAGGGRGRMLASVLHARGPSSIGLERWNSLLTSFNDLIRLHARVDTSAPDPKHFFWALRSARSTCSDEDVTEILNWMWQFREYVSNYGSMDSRTRFREFDPIFGTLTSVALTWRIRLGDVPIEFLVDRYGSLDEATVEMIMKAATEPLPVEGVGLPLGLLRSIRAVDSKEDSRVQIADILAGCGRAISTLAGRGILHDELENVSREMLDCSGMWPDGSGLDALWDIAPPRYYRAWTAANS